MNAIVGIFDTERLVPQEVIINLEMACDIAHAAASENIEDTVDYSAVAKRVSEFVIQSKFLLLETLVEKTAALIMKEFGIVWISLSCMKTQALTTTRGVGVKIERGIKPSN